MSINYNSNKNNNICPLINCDDLNQRHDNGQFRTDNNTFKINTKYKKEQNKMLKNCFLKRNV